MIKIVKAHELILDVGEVRKKHGYLNNTVKGRITEVDVHSFALGWLIFFGQNEDDFKVLKDIHDISECFINSGVKHLDSAEAITIINNQGIKWELI